MSKTVRPAVGPAISTPPHAAVWETTDSLSKQQRMRGRAAAANLSAMATQLRSGEPGHPGGDPEAARDYADPLLELEVADLMTPGCVVISEHASVADAATTMARHRVHAVLVLGASNGTPLGWITHRGLLAWIGRDRSQARCTEAITEQVRAIPAHASIRTAQYALSLAGTTRLLVRSKPDRLPEGVLSDFDLAMAAGQ